MGAWHMFQIAVRQSKVLFSFSFSFWSQLSSYSQTLNSTIYLLNVVADVVVLRFRYVTTALVERGTKHFHVWCNRYFFVFFFSFLLCRFVCVFACVCVCVYGMRDDQIYKCFATINLGDCLYFNSFTQSTFDGINKFSLFKQYKRPKS